jgi:hypothetical protein
LHLPNFFFFQQKVKILSFVISLMCLHHVLSEQPKYQQQQQPLVFKNWPPNRNSAAIRANAMKIHLRGSGSSNIASRIPPPGMFIKSASPIRFGIPMRAIERQKGASSNHVFFKAGYPQASVYKRPYAAHLTASQGGFKFSSPAHKTAIKFQVCC